MATVLETKTSANDDHVRGSVSAEEWAVRVDLAAAYRLVALYGWDDLIFTHLSARVPGPEHHFLINPYDMMFEEITASSLVKIDVEGQPVIPTAHPVNPAGFTIHSAIHEARDDAICVLHTHTFNGAAVAAQDGGVLPISQPSIFVLNSLAYHDYEGLALNHDEKPRLVADFGDKTFLILRNHGLLTAGATIEEAAVLAIWLEQAADAQLRAAAVGPRLGPCDRAHQRPSHARLPKRSAVVAGLLDEDDPVARPPLHHGRRSRPCGAGTVAQGNRG